MVLSLVDLSLRSIMSGIINGTIRHPHFLPPKLRELVFDTAIKQGLPYHPNGLELLSSVEFLNGMTSISAKACYDNDSELLKRLISSLATKLPNGETIGNSIKKLNLKVYEYGVRRSSFKNKKTYRRIISKVSDLIAQCPNMVSLDLHLDKSGAARGFWPLNENEKNSACNRVMENLVELSVALYTWDDIVDIERPVINFKQLKTLKLDNCSFYNGTWPELLEKIPLVENLHFFDVHSNENALDWILPTTLPHLKSLEVLGDVTFKCNKAFVDKLMECQQLRQVHLKLDHKSSDEESLVRLAKMNIDLKLKIRLVIAGNDATENAAIFDSSSRFKLVRIFHEKTESFELEVSQEWNEQYSTALEDVVDTCSNLTSFDIAQPRFNGNQTQIEFEEKKRFNAALIRFFGTRERAQQLEVLRLDGNFGETLLSTVFENCLNLVRLHVINCSTLRDQHLIDWAERGGGKLTDFGVSGCDNVTCVGIISILARSAEKLLRYRIKLDEGNSGRNWTTVLRNRCPNAQ